jgi:hypothetical protein
MPRRPDQPRLEAIARAPNGKFERRRPTALFNDPAREIPIDPMSRLVRHAA